MGLGRTFRLASAGVGIAGLAAFVLPSAAAYGATITVSPGQSIQTAVNNAHAGKRRNSKSSSPQYAYGTRMSPHQNRYA